jgi:hypothetical protein
MKNINGFSTTTQAVQQGAAQAAHRQETPAVQDVRRTILECLPGGVLTLLELTDETGESIQLLELLPSQGKVQRIGLRASTLAQLCAWWQAKMSGGQ